MWIQITLYIYYIVYFIFKLKARVYDLHVSIKN